MLIQARAEVDARSNYGNTPLASAILWNKHDVAELLLDKGAKINNIKITKIPDWMKSIVIKRENVKRSLTTFIGVLRKRFTLSGGGWNTEYTRGRFPLDLVRLLGRLVWATRFDERWATAIPETASRCHLQ